MIKEKRSNKWTFLLYKESAPENYLDIIESLHTPYVLSPWHDKDINKQTGEFKKSHKHGALFFDSLKSYSQVSELLTQNLNTPAHVEVVLSPKGLYDYFIHAENPEKTLYDIKDIESGCGFDLEKFILENSYEDYLARAIDIINRYHFTEFSSLVNYARANDPLLLKVIILKPYFFSKLLDSLRYNRSQYEKEIKQIEEDEEYYRQQNLRKKKNQIKKEELDR